MSSAQSDSRDKKESVEIYEGPRPTEIQFQPKVMSNRMHLDIFVVKKLVQLSSAARIKDDVEERCITKEDRERTSRRP